MQPGESRERAEREPRCSRDAAETQVEPRARATALPARAQEVIFGAPFGFGIDMWSLGVTLCELFAGRYLLQAASRGGLAVQVRPPSSPPPPDGARIVGPF